jgi:UDP-N-acetylglucosamine 2-epimerase (non-hydrolysing)|tara:strand:- start:1541 stop:2620 length:1080 start_codon:yes stop_codon:yes gene_type:complete
VIINSYDVALVVGTRPNFIKAAPLVKYFESKNLKVLFIHTGQHWDKNLSGNIFTDLELREPDVNLETPLDGMNHQLSYMIKSLDTTLSKTKVPRLGVFGDVTSTLAAALVAKNRDLELFHVESGLRSRNMNMPEERNRLAVDTISDYLFTPSDDAVQNLLDENIEEEKIFNVGNIMIDTLKANIDKILSSKSYVVNDLNINEPYFVMTLHRPSNLTNEALHGIFTALDSFKKDYKILIPAHPRLSQFIQKNNLQFEDFMFIDPLPYIKFLGLVSGAELVLTDSGGLQEETTYLNVKCLTLREETERPITVTQGTNKVVGINTEVIINEINNSLDCKLSNEIKIKNWDGFTSSRIFEALY